jgi:hypothetical protein
MDEAPVMGFKANTHICGDCYYFRPKVDHKTGPRCECHLDGTVYRVRATVEQNSCEWWWEIGNV